MSEDLYGSFQIFLPMDVAIAQSCDELGLKQLSGGSGKGWSMYSTMQRCPRAYYYRYVEKREEDKEAIDDGSVARGVGGLVHALLALYYCGEDYTDFLAALLQKNVRPEVVYEAKRLMDAYKCWYEVDYLEPIEVEYRAEDPKTGNSCRYDLLAMVRNQPGIEDGLYIVEHKTAKSFTWEVMEGWDMDGEILGEIALWNRAGMKKKFGELQGLIVNVIGKQKDIKFHRAFVHPQEKASKYHLKVLKEMLEFKDLMQRKRWPRFFQGCITRYGKCDSYNRCQREVIE